MPEGYDTIVVGAGPAGIAAAIQTHRSGWRTALFEGKSPGGLLRNANLVENYPGFPGGVRGARLAGLMERHLEENGPPLIREMVESLGHDGRVFTAKTKGGRYEALTAVLASGTVPLIPEDLVISARASERVFFEVTGAAGLKKKSFAVIGGGDAAYDYALSLAPGNRVTVLTRSAKARCLPLLYERCGRKRNISIMLSTGVEAIEREGEKLVLRLAERKEPIEADYALIAVGRRSCIDYLEDHLLEKIELLSKRGILYLAGDVANGRFRQAAISAGDGIRAAMALDSLLRSDRR